MPLYGAKNIVFMKCLVHVQRSVCFHDKPSCNQSYSNAILAFARAYVILNAEYAAFGVHPVNKLER